MIAAFTKGKGTDLLCDTYGMHSWQSFAGSSANVHCVSENSSTGEVKRTSDIFIRSGKHWFNSFSHQYYFCFSNHGFKKKQLWCCLTSLTLSVYIRCSESTLLRRGLTKTCWKFWPSFFIAACLTSSP